jgi:acyl-ACP thioesterase
MYSFDSKIRYSEIDKDGKLTLEALINYFQDCSIFQTQQGPADIAYMNERNVAWVLNSWQIEVSRFPGLCEEVVIGTVPYELRGVFGLRNFVMDTKDGERLAVANSLWTLFDFEKGVPSKVTPEMLETYPIGEKISMNYGDRKIKIPEGADKRAGESLQVRPHHLDTNDHVNNGQYIRMALDCLAQRNAEITSMRAEYKMQAKLGDFIYPEVYLAESEDADTYIVSLNNEEGKVYCVVEFVTGASCK